MTRNLGPAGLSVVFATAAGLLTNVFTEGWSLPVGVGLVCLMVLWMFAESRAIRSRSRGPLASKPKAKPPLIWNVEAQSSDFTDRDDILGLLRRQLTEPGGKRVQVLRGIGGVGKTQLAIEYAYRNEEDYDIVWWINSEDETLIGEQLSALGVAMKLVEPGTPVNAAANTVKAKLRQTPRWLLIFDSADNPKVIHSWLPGGRGHVLITSRVPGWESDGHTTIVEPLGRDDSMALLQAHDHDLTPTEAYRLAEALGDLPLALVQAGGYLSETGISVGDYLSGLESRAGELLKQGMTGQYPRSLAAAVLLTVNRLEREDPVGLAIVRLGAFLAPENIPVEWLSGVDTHRLPGAEVTTPLISATSGSGKIVEGVASAARFGMVTVTGRGFRLHRLVQLIIRDHLEYPERNAFRALARAVLLSHRPGDPEDPTAWLDWARVVPHLLAVEPSLGTEAAWCEMACDASWYMIERGDSVAAARLAEDLRDKWNRSLGPDHAFALLATRSLARALRENGDYHRAKALYADALERYTRMMGELHPDTLRLAHGSAINLHLMGHYAEALSLQKSTWQKYRRVKGENFLHTLHSANHAANAQRELGMAGQAREWHEDTLVRYRSTVGADNPDTLRCASNLAMDLRALNRNEEARVIQEDILVRRRRVLGEDNRYTLQSASDLGETLLELGQFQQAQKLLRDTLVRCRTALGQDHPETLSCAIDFARAQHSLGLDSAACPLAREVYEACRRTLGEDNPLTLKTAGILASILSAMGNQDESHDIRQRIAALRHGVGQQEPTEDGL